jgi:hypothetical protein
MFDAKELGRYQLRHKCKVVAALLAAAAAADVIQALL